MDFKAAAKLCAYISKDHAEEIFRLLVNYKNISASEAASRLNLHIQTAQDFLEAMAFLGIIAKKEVYEKKRPYFRYSLLKQNISMDIDLTSLLEKSDSDDRLSLRIRESSNAEARFTTARYDAYFSRVIIWTGKGRQREERKIHLTIPQGKFLYHLPFPTAEFQSVANILKKAGVEIGFLPEIMDIVELLKKYSVIMAE